MRSTRTAGLDIGTSAVRGVELALVDGHVRVERYAEVPLPVGAVNNGEIVADENVAAAVRALWKAGRFRTKRVAVSVANRRVIVRQVDLPWVPPAEMRGALYYQAQDLLPIPIEDSVIDHHVVDEYVGEGGSRMSRLMLVAADAGMVTRTVDCVRAAGLHVAVVDLTPFALLRAVAALGRAAGDVQTEAIVDVGASVTNILVHSGGRPRFVRILLLGGDDVTASIVEAIGVSIDDAEVVKREDDAVADHPTVPLGHPATAAVRRAAGVLIEEVRGSLDYYRAQPAAVPLSRVVLSGGGSRLAGLQDQLAAVTRLPVVRLEEVSGLQLPTPRGDADAVPADVPAVSVGLALRAAA